MAINHICEELKLLIKSGDIEEIIKHSDEWQVSFFGCEGYESLRVTHCPYCGVKSTD
jgi:rRNA maturation endonuclease Nob1